jgi:anti-anti-sigma factor
VVIGMGRKSVQATEVRPAMCETSHERGRFVVTLNGELDLTAVARPEFAAALASYRCDEPVDVILDLAGVTFVDSVGLAWLVSMRSAATLANRKVRVRHVPLGVEKVLRSAGLRRYFPDEAPEPLADL